MGAFAQFGTVNLAVFAALALLSVMATTVSVVKFVQFASLGVGRRRAAEAILADWLAGQRERAMRAAGPRAGILGRVLHATLSALAAKPDDPGWAEELGRQVALGELARISRGMRMLEATVQAAPMMGLLGTVVGMIDAFGALARASGAVDPTQLAGGIWTALTTTAIGLAIALFFYFVSTWLEGRIDAERQAMELAISAAVHGRIEPDAR